MQGIAEADEIYVTDEVYRAPGVADSLEPFDVAPRDVSLKGMQRRFNVFRVARAAP